MSSAAVVSDFVSTLRLDPAACAAFVYCVLGGVGPAPIHAVFLKTKFDQLAPWDRVNVIHDLRDIIHEHLRAAGAEHTRVARVADDLAAAAREASLAAQSPLDEEPT